MRGCNSLSKRSGLLLAYEARILASLFAVSKSKKSWPTTTLTSANTFVMGNKNEGFMHGFAYHEAKDRAEVEI
jgi:hypothetical protein